MCECGCECVCALVTFCFFGISIQVQAASSKMLHVPIVFPGEDEASHVCVLPDGSSVGIGGCLIELRHFYHRVQKEKLSKFFER